MLQREFTRSGAVARRGRAGGRLVDHQDLHAPGFERRARGALELRARAHERDPSSRLRGLSGRAPCAHAQRQPNPRGDPELPYVERGHDRGSTMRAMSAIYTALLITHFLGLAIGLGSGFAQFTLGLATRDLSPPERGQFMQRAAALGKNGSVGLLLLILSGLGMTTIRGWSATMQWGGGAFHAKLGLVVLMIGVFGYLQVLGRRVRLAGGGPALALLPKVSRVMLSLGIAVVIAAAIAFQ